MSRELRRRRLAFPWRWMFTERAVLGAYGLKVEAISQKPEASPPSFLIEKDLWKRCSWAPGRLPPELRGSANIQGRRERRVAAICLLHDGQCWRTGHAGLASSAPQHSMTPQTPPVAAPSPQPSDRLEVKGAHTPAPPCDRGPGLPMPRAAPKCSLRPGQWAFPL